MTSHDSMGSGSERLAVIFNMGAGYCDVAVTATAGGVSQIKALAGSAVGGEDVLQNTMRHIAPPSKEGSGSLRVATQDAVHRLSKQESVQIEVDLGDGDVVCKVLDRVFAAVLMPGSKSPVVPVIEVRMPTVDDGHGWCAQALNAKFGAALDLVTLQRK
ncbi:Heat shock 70 kDa protein 8 [Raphanus sativus]|nr:Heat shock 70 kDa protein 8 [Raphanus sativus]